MSSVNLSKYTIVELKSLLRTYGLPLSGNKDILVSRIENELPMDVIKKFILDKTSTSKTSKPASKVSTSKATKIYDGLTPEIITLANNSTNSYDDRSIISDKSIKHTIFKAFKNGYPFKALGISFLGFRIQNRRRVYDYKYEDKSTITDLNNFIKGIKHTTSLETLYLFGDMYLYPVGLLEQLSTALIQNDTIKHLEAPFGIPTYKILSPYIKTATFDSAFNMPTDTNIHMFCDHLSSAKSLEQLKILPGDIGKQNFDKLSISLKSLNSLKILNLNDRSFHDHNTIYPILQSIQSMPNVEELYLNSSNGFIYIMDPKYWDAEKMTLPMATIIADFLRKNNTLRVLGISRFKFDYVQYDIIASALMDNTTIIDLGNTDIDFDMPLNKIIRRNRLIYKSMTQLLLDNITDIL